jgi:60 kDa SS-A/Ro ribonucleoprotein
LGKKIGSTEIPGRFLTTKEKGGFMSFNPPRQGHKVATYEGGTGFLARPEAELLLLVAGSLFSGDSYYEKDESRKERFHNLASEVSRKDPHFVASLAQYARQVLGLRSGPSALVTHLFWWGPKEVAEEAARGVWLRGDEHLETLAYARAYGWKITKGLKKAVASRLNSMSPAALLKYQKRGRSFSQRDALIISHPKPQDQNHALVYEWMIRGKKALPEAQAFVSRILEERPTWERILSTKGSSRESWLEALPHLKGLSLVRNLSNLHSFNLLQEEEVQEILASKLLSPEVAKWGIWPYQWLQAISMGRKEGWPEPVLHLLETALENTLPPLNLEGETLILVDISGSMSNFISERSKATYALAAASLGALLYRRTGGLLVGFNNDIHLVQLSPEAPVARLVEELTSRVWGGTYLGKALEKTLPNFSGRRVVIFTDEQVHDNAYEPLRKWIKAGSERVAHVVNVAGYPFLAFPENGVVRVGGWSERLLDILTLMEARDPVAWIRNGEWRTRAPLSSPSENEGALEEA